MHTKRIMPLLAVIGLLAAVANPLHASAQKVELPPEIKNIDAEIEAVLPKLDLLEVEYMAWNGKYYQALESHSATPDADVKADINRLTAKPTDQAESLAYFWADASKVLPTQMAWSFRIDTYDGPSGLGYVLTATTLIKGVAWERSLNRGGEKWRDADWYQVLPDELGGKP